MDSKRDIGLLLLLFFFLLPEIPLHAAEGGKLIGKVIDKATRESMVAANVVIEGTSLGCATDPDGNFMIQFIPPGVYKVKTSYIGYTPAVENEVRVTNDQTTTINFELTPVGITVESIVITAQARGQNQAINRQLAADQIMNVVSSARIQELPDANAAESIARLPGVSIERSGGEGNQVVIRGMQPKYNSVSVDGVRMSSTNKDDRSIDLSMISPNMLEGIEVSKTVTPDQDADVLGGTVNFKMREAKGETEGLGVEILGQGGYSGLPDAYHKYNNYKYVGSVEGRFLDQKLGVFVQGDLERRNLTSNELGATYEQTKNDFISYLTDKVNLDYIDRDRQRTNGTINLDYKLPEGKIGLSNFVSSGTTYTEDRGESYVLNGGANGGNVKNYTFTYTASTVNMITNTLKFEQQLPVFHMDAKLSHTYSEVKDPNDFTATCQQGNTIGLGPLASNTNLNPMDVVKAANNSLSVTNLSGFSNTNSFTRERTLTASLDFDAPVNLSDVITSIVKFGGKYRYQTRSFVSDVYNDEQPFGGTSTTVVTDTIEGYFGLPKSGHIPIGVIMDPNFNYGKFLNGDYKMIAPLNASLLSRFSTFMRNIYSSMGSKLTEGYGRDNYQSNTNNYSGNEALTAFYLMATINLGSRLTIIPGVRYQDLQTQYTGVRGQQTVLNWSNYNHIDTTVTVDHAYWLPDVNLRYKPFSWFDIRLSYTNTLAYPDYNTIIPRSDVGLSAIVYNNYQLKPTRSKNYDAYFSFYENTIGLFTVGVFVKQIDDLIYYKPFTALGAAVSQYVLWRDTSNKTPLPTQETIDTYVNDPYRINNYGLELEWQTHFWYLPKPFDGLVFNINYTHIYSRALYPYVYAHTVGSFHSSKLVITDTSYIDRLIQQPDNIVNLSIGYDYKGFSIRVSMLYQTDVNTGYNFWPQLRTVTNAYKRWDVSVKQNLPWFGLQLYADLNNVNGAQDVTVLAMYPNTSQAQQTYDITADIGLRWQL